MKLQSYVLSKMCHSRDAAVHGITKFKSSHFTGTGVKLYTIIKTLYKLNGEVDLHVLTSQAAAQNVKESVANKIYQYANGQTDNWQNVFQEFKQKAIKRNIRQDYQLLLDEIDQKTPQELAGLTTKKATDWISDAEKRYYSGKEVDELDEEYGDPIQTGYTIIDDQIYKHGGNLKGQMKGVICREKHGKTRSECWECAQNLRQGHKVLYITCEGRKSDITGNLRQVLKDDWGTFREQFFVVDGVVHIDEIESVIMEAVLIEQVDKVVVDYIQLVMADGSSENVRINNATERLRNLMVKMNFNLSLLSQSKKESANASVPRDTDGNKILPNGWKYVPSVNDAYGSMALIKAATIILIGYRPNLYEENVEHGPIGSKVVNPVGEKDTYHSFYMMIARTRYKPENLHRWFRFIDSDEGLRRPQWV